MALFSRKNLKAEMSIDDLMKTDGKILCFGKYHSFNIVVFYSFTESKKVYRIGVEDSKIIPGRLTVMSDGTIDTKSLFDSSYPYYNMFDCYILDPKNPLQASIKFDVSMEIKNSVKRNETFNKLKDRLFNLEYINLSPIKIKELSK